MKGPLTARLRARARKLKRRITALLLAVSDPATPWYAKLCGVLVVAYAVSPFDLIPDFIPVLGLLDDLVLLPLGVLLTLRLIPRQVFLSALRRAAKGERMRTGNLRLAGVIGIVALWLIAAVIVALIVTGVLWRR